jgi:serine/threonine protein kinase
MFKEEKWTAVPSLDMWSFGQNLLELLCGTEANLIREMMRTCKPPFDSLSTNEQFKHIQIARDKTIENLALQPIPEKAKKLISSLLEMDPEKRPSSQDAQTKLQELFLKS